jgi:hypothetical protein
VCSDALVFSAEAGELVDRQKNGGRNASMRRRQQAYKISIPTL